MALPPQHAATDAQLTNAGLRNDNMRFWMNHRGWAVLAALCLSAGCGGDGMNRVPVSGQATANGTPIAAGNLTLIPLEGTSGPSAGAAIENGRYDIPDDKGPVPGRYRVEIKATRKTGRQIIDEHRFPPDNKIDEMEQYIPPQFNLQSTLTVDIADGKNRDVNFDLQWEDKKQP